MKERWRPPEVLQMLLSDGDPAPTFVLPAHDGTTFDLRDVLGRWVLLWWYPRASTPTCTREGDALRDCAARFDEARCVIAGVSYDGPQDNRAFAEAREFPFRLLSDVAREVSMSYGTVRVAGEPYDDMPRRRSFLIDPAGRIARSYDVTDPEAHPHHVLADLAAFTASSDTTIPDRSRPAREEGK